MLYETVTKNLLLLLWLVTVHQTCHYTHAKVIEYSANKSSFVLL